MHILCVPLGFPWKFFRFSGAVVLRFIFTLHEFKSDLHELTSDWHEIKSEFRPKKGKRKGKTVFVLPFSHSVSSFFFFCPA